MLSITRPGRGFAICQSRLKKCCDGLQDRYSFPRFSPGAGAVGCTHVHFPPKATEPVVQPSSGYECQFFAGTSTSTSSRMLPAGSWCGTQSVCDFRFLLVNSVRILVRIGSASSQSPLVI